MNKSAYFTAENLVSVARQMCSELEPYLHRHQDQVFDPSRAGMLVLDMQNYFLLPESHAFVPSAIAIIDRILSLINAFRSNGRPVIFTRHVDQSLDDQMMSRWWRGAILPDSANSWIHPRYDNLLDCVMEKHHYDAFLESELDKILHDNDISQVVITGVLTHLCCETTARSAFMHNYEVFFVVDGTATYNERHHRATLFNLAHGFAVPVLAGEVLNGFRS